jgi:SAM-dependent methyltransferase
MTVEASERRRWETRHGQSLKSMSLDPASLLVDYSDHLRDVPAGRAIDIGCGNGRNAFFLASLGYDVTAVDFSSPAVQYVRERAAELGVKVQPIQADIGDFDLGEDRYVVVANFLFLDRNLAPRIIRALTPGGLLYFETFTTEERDVVGHDIRREFCLEPNEALRLFAPLHILYYREGLVPAKGKDGEPRAVAQLIARRLGSPLGAPA